MAAAINAATGARFSRNAIAGQAKRLALPLRRRPNRGSGPRPASPRPATRILAVNLRRRKARAPACVPDEIVHADAPPHLALTLLELNDATCRYPRGSETFTFCGQPTEADRPYCGFHLRLCYAPHEGRASGTQRRAA
jgi:GcrA cell cycle regulator